MKKFEECNYPFLELIGSGLLTDFFSDHVENDLNQVRNFIESQHQKKILQIKSELGNGGTHLLSAVANELILREIKFASFSCRGVVKVYNNFEHQFEDYLVSCEYCLIDCLHYFSDKPLVFGWLKKTLTEFVSNGGKLVVSTNYDIERQSLSNYFQTDLIVEANTSFPSIETLKKIGATLVSEQIVEDNANEIFLKSQNVRSFVNQLITVEASEIRQE